MAKISLRRLAKRFAAAMSGSIESDVSFLQFRDGFIAITQSETSAHDILTLAESYDGRTELGISRGGTTFCVLHRGEGDLPEVIGLYEDRVDAQGDHPLVDYRDGDEPTIKRFAESLGVLED